MKIHDQKACRLGEMFLKSDDKDEQQWQVAKSDEDDEQSWKLLKDDQR